MSLRLECTTEGHNKFWECDLDGDTTTVHFGKIGSSPRESVKKHASAEKALQFYNRKVTQKKKEGYVAVQGEDNAEENHDEDSGSDAEPPEPEEKRPRTSGIMGLISEVGDGDFQLTEDERKKIKSEAAMDDQLKAQVTYIMANCYWGGAKEISECFDEMNMDNGIMWCTILSCGGEAQAKLFYWLAYCGGNPTGYLLSGEGDEIQLLIENCDGDFIWHGGGKKPRAFVRQVRKAVK